MAAEYGNLGPQQDGVMAAAGRCEIWQSLYRHGPERYVTGIDGVLTLSPGRRAGDE